MTRPVISFAGARASYVGPSLSLGPHSNAAAVLAVALGGAFDLDVFEGGQLSRAVRAQGAALIPPRTRHHLRGVGPMAFLYFDGLHDDIALLRHADLEGRRAAVLREGRRAWLSWDVDDWCDAFALRRRSPDARIAAIVAGMADDPDRFPNAVAAARHAGLSSSRFQALFAQTLGVPFRKWRTWRRLAVAFMSVRDGATLTAAAHLAGFSSSAHLSTAFRAMFGLSPSSLIARRPELRVAPTPRGLERSGDDAGRSPPNT